MNAPSSKSGDPGRAAVFDCGDLQDLLSDYMLRALSTGQESALRAHAMGCGACQGRLLELLRPPWDLDDPSLQDELDAFSVPPFQLDDPPLLPAPMDGVRAVALPPALEAALAEEEARTAAEARAYRRWGPRARRAAAALSGAALGLSLVWGIGSLDAPHAPPAPQPQPEEPTTAEAEPPSPQVPASYVPWHGSL